MQATLNTATAFHSSFRLSLPAQNFCAKSNAFTAVLLVLLTIGLGNTNIANADTEPSASSIAEHNEGDTISPNDNGDWTGDVIKIANDVYDVKAASKDDTTDHFVPDGAIFTVVSDDSTTHKLIVKFRNVKAGGTDVTVDETGGNFHYSPSETKRKMPENLTAVDTHNLYTFDKAAIEKMDYYRHGWSFGGLLVPYKYQLSDKSFGSALSIGPYLGYRSEDRGSSLVYLMSAGYVSNIPVPLADKSGTVNRSGFTVAVGVIATIDKGSGIQVGLIAGQDRLGSNSLAPYEYEGKTWLSIAIGFKFF
jgi:hypothetical protein